MSDQTPDQPKPAAIPEPAGDPKPVAGKLEAKKMTFLDQIFIWVMVLLVGVIFGVGPSIGLALQGGSQAGSYKVDSSQVQRRQRIAVVLQEILNPNPSPFSGGPLFSVAQVQRGPYPYLVQRDEESYARDIRKAQLAADAGLKASSADLHRLMEDFLATKLGEGTFAQKIRDSRRAREVTTADLELWLGEQFAIAALDAQSSVAPAIPAAAAAVFKAFMDEKVPTDQVVLSAKPLLTPVGPEDPEFKATYEDLAQRDRFVLPAAVVVQAAAADFAAILAAQPVPADDQAKAWYEAHKDDYRKPAADPAVAPATGPDGKPVVEYRPFDEVKAEIAERLRRAAAGVAAQAKVEAFVVTVEDLALEQSDAAAFAKAVGAAGLQVHEGLEIPESPAGEVTVPGFGALKRSAREVGLANKPGTITDPQETGDGRWLVLRIAARKPAARKPIDDPSVREAVGAALAARRAYPLLLKEAEALRAQAEKAGPGGLRAAFADPALKAKWGAEVTTADLSPLKQLEAPAPSDKDAARPEPRAVASLAVAGNPVALVADGDPAGELPTVRLVQATGLAASTPPTAEERGQLAERLHDGVGNVLAGQAEVAVGRKL